MSFNHTLAPQNRELFDKMHLQLQSPLTKMANKHDVICTVCLHQFSAILASKVQNYKVHGAGGCPVCTKATRSVVLKAAHSRKPFQQFLDEISVKLPTTIELSCISTASQCYDANAGGPQHTKVQWRCLADAAHATWTTSFASIVAGHGCPECGAKKSAITRQLMGKSTNLTQQLAAALNSKVKVGPHKVPFVEVGNMQVSIVALVDVMEQKFPKYALHDVPGIVFFEDEWKSSQQLILQKIHHVTKSVILPVIYARKCEVRKISNQQAGQLFNIAHIQGNVAAQYCYGLFYNDELVAAQTFSSPRVMMSKGEPPGTYELVRYATNPKYRVPGGASKLLQAFVRDGHPTKIFSLSDMRWSEGNLYQQLGFSKKADNPPDYFYVVNNERKHRWGFRKDLLKQNPKVQWDVNRTEYDMVLKDLGHDRVWGKGTTRWEIVC
jgi:hypothetical protein